MLGIGVLEDALAAEHLHIILAKELNLLVLMRVAVLYPAVLGGPGGPLVRAGVHLSNRQGCEHRIVDRQVVRVHMVRNLVKGALDDRVLVYLPQTLQAESVAAGQGQGFLL
jgi:hypothetical protein